MTSDAPCFAYGDDATIASVYRGVSADCSLCVVSKWFMEDRKELLCLKDIYLSEEPEGRFLLALEAGSPISDNQVLKNISFFAIYCK